MAYRNGTYIAFAADGGTNIFDSDIKYYRLIQGWDLMKNRDFKIVNSHEKGPSLRQGSLDETIKRTLRGRLDNSNRLLLLVGKTTKFDDDFVPYEIEYAIDTCNLPVIVCYVEERNRITNSLSNTLKNKLPKVLLDRINNGKAKTIHIPFRQRILNQALNDFKYGNAPNWNITLYSDALYDKIYDSNEI
jgi:hypothetical protein